VRLRIRFSKLGKVRWTSHRDVARMWERALRRARVPLRYTAGFSPRPQLSFGLALPTGCESVAEYLDAVLAEPVGLEGFGALVSPLLPEGVDALGVGLVEPGTGSLQEEVSSCAWEIAVPDLDADALDAVVARVLGAPHLPVGRERKGRRVTDDLRPAIVDLSRAGGRRPAVVLLAELRTRPRGVRPSELAEAMGVTLGPARRTGQWIERDGSRWEPLTTDAALAAIAGERVP